MKAALRILLGAIFIVSIMVQFFIITVVTTALDHALMVESPLFNVVLYIGVVWVGCIEWQIVAALVAGGSFIALLELSKGHPKTVFQCQQAK